jgi:hypothetical protein
MPKSIKRNNSAETGPLKVSRWVHLSITIGIVLFILALIISAIVVPQLRLLHLLQALIYVAIFILTRHNNPLGFGAAVFIAIAWNSLNLFITHLFQAGAGLLWSFIRTGQLNRPDTAMVFIASMAHYLLIVSCLAGFLQPGPGKKQWYLFFAGGLLVLAYMALIIFIAAPR